MSTVQTAIDIRPFHVDIPERWGIPVESAHLAGVRREGASMYPR